MRKEYTHNHEKYHGDYLHAMAIAVTTVPDRCLSFQMIFTGCESDFDESQKNTFELARQVVERSYPTEDVAVLRKFKKKYGDPCDVVAKDKCFYFSHSEDVDDEGDTKETKSHFLLSLHSKLICDLNPQ